MRRTHWSKTGKAIKKANPSLFNVATGHPPKLKAGAHKTAKDYNRAETRKEERNARYTD